MTGLLGLVITYVAVITAVLVFAIVGIYNLLASVPDWKLVSASFAALLTMLVLAFLFYVDDKGWLDVPRKLFDVLGFIWPVLAVVVAVVVYKRV